MYWCENCKKKASKGYINTDCLACKWQYVGQEAFDRKSDLFEEWQYVGQEAFDRKSDLFEGKDVDSVNPAKTLGNLTEWAGCVII